MTPILPINSYLITDSGLILKTNSSIKTAIKASLVSFILTLFLTAGVCKAPKPDSPLPTEPVSVVAEPRVDKTNAISVSTEKLIGKIQTINPKLTADESKEIVKHTKRASLRYDININLLLGLMYVESRFDIHAKSNMGALGLTQVIPKWHQDKIKTLQSETSVYSIYEPKFNILLGAYILKEYRAQSKSWNEALLRYNGALGKDTNYPDLVLAAARTF